MNKSIFGFGFLAITLLNANGWCQDTIAKRVDATVDPAVLTIDRIYKTSDFQEKSFSGRWVQNDNDVFLVQKKKSTEYPGHQDLVRYDLDGTEQVMVAAADLVPSGETNPLKIEGYELSSDQNWLLIYTNSKRVWRNNTRGDYWILDRSSRQLKKLGGDIPASTMMFAKMDPNAKKVAYVHENNIFVQDLLSWEIRSLTHGNGEIINGTTDWVYEEELGLRDAFRWSPDGSRIAYWQLDTSSVPKFPLVNNTDSLYPKVTWFAYPKVGQTNPSAKVGVVNVNGNSTSWIPIPGDPRDHYLPRMEFVPDTNQLLIQQLNRLQNQNRVFLHNQNQSIQTILTERDDAWVDMHNEVFGVGDSGQFTWASDRSGWRHIYLASLDSDKDPQPVTSGEFDVIELLHVDQEERLAYFIASPDDATQRFLFSASLDGNDQKRITPASFKGNNDYRISPDGKWAIHLHSHADQPTQTRLIALPDHREVQILEDNRKLVETFENLDKLPTEFFQVDIGDGVKLDGWCIKPPNFDPNAKSKYPLVTYVYGEPAGSTVRNRWGGSSYLWHLMLAQKGIVVMSFDNRGTKAPRGRAFRKSIYKKIGILPPQDQAAAVRAVLKNRPYLDSKRVGVWGWSGGGSSSLQAIFKYPEIYHTALAVAPVPNQRYYDTIYQERYMSLPELNVDGFREGSAINFAKNLKGNLLLIHGTADDNCHYQTTEMLIDELIAHNKQFTMFAYPNRTHAVRERKNTTRHLRTMMTNYLLEKLQ